MSLNSHLQRREQAVASRCVLFDEVTEAYEKLHATVTLWVLHRAVDRFRFVVPDGFEIAEIDSPLLARWDVETEAGRKIVNVRLREQTTDTVVLSIAAVKTPSQLKAWRMPRLEMLDVVGQVTVLGLLVEDQLKAESLADRRPDPGRYGRARHGAAGDARADGARRGRPALHRRLLRAAKRLRVEGRFQPYSRDACRDHEPAAEDPGEGLRGPGRVRAAAHCRETIQLRLQRAGRLDGARGHRPGPQAAGDRAPCGRKAPLSRRERGRG